MKRAETLVGTLAGLPRRPAFGRAPARWAWQGLLLLQAAGLLIVAASATPAGLVLRDPLAAGLPALALPLGLALLAALASAWAARGGSARPATLLCLLAGAGALGLAWPQAGLHSAAAPGVLPWLPRLFLAAAMALSALAAVAAGLPAGDHRLLSAAAARQWLWAVAGGLLACALAPAPA